MPESTMPRYLSHGLARELADEIECAIASVRSAFQRKHDAELRGLEHEIALALARAAVRYGLDLLPNTSAAAIDRLEVAVAELDAKLEAARMAQPIERPRGDMARARIRAYALGVKHTEAKASAELAAADESLRYTAPELVLDRARFLGADKIANTAIAAVEVFGAGSLADLALAELWLYVDERTVEEFEAAARAYFDEVGLEVRSFVLEHKTAIFRVGSGK